MAKVLCSPIEATKFPRIRPARITRVGVEVDTFIRRQVVVTERGIAVLGETMLSLI
jgi:hypothetical protein